MTELEALMACKYQEAHEAHMDLNGECPWCGYSTGQPADYTAGLPAEEAVAAVERRHG